MVKTYISRPIAVNAIQYTGSNEDEVIQFCPSMAFENGRMQILVDSSTYVIGLTGDYVAKLVDGSFTIFSKQVFEAEYEECSGRTYACTGSLF